MKKRPFSSPNRGRSFSPPGQPEGSFGDFECIHCKRRVSAASRRSGVLNRNHCPYCLSSRHLDLFEAGDRMSPCKSRMAPIGLTFKKTAKKYAHPGSGELMIVHRCEGCGKLSINRIAAEDDTDQILQVFASSTNLDDEARTRIAADGIVLISSDEENLVRRQLFGEISE